MRSAIEIANWFILEKDVTHLKLQKLLYIAFGIHYCEHREPLFFDQFEAWKYGPVLQNIYLHLKIFGRSKLTLPIYLMDGTVLVTKDSKVIESLNLTWEQFGNMTASELVAWTHAEGSPWDEAYGEREDSTIRPIGAAQIFRWFADFWQDVRPQPALTAEQG